MRPAFPVALFLAMSPGLSLADTAAADACAAKLSPVAQEIYKTTLASNPTPADGRSLVVAEVEKLIKAGTVTMSEGRAAGEAAGKCLEMLE